MKLFPKTPKVKDPRSCNLINFASDPIQVSLGTETETEADYDFDNFELKRTYLSAGVYSAVHPLGANWRFDYDRKLVLDSSTQITAQRPNGTYLVFLLVNNVWTPDADVADKLTALSGGGWAYFDASTNSTENFNSSGFLTFIVSENNRTISFTSDSMGSIQTIVNDVGQQITFTYDSATGRVTQVQLPDNGIITYTYDANNNLSTVTYPDGKSKTYYYGEGAYISSSPLPGVHYLNSMTGVVDENGNRFATWNYDNVGHASSSEHAGGVEKSILSYNTDGFGNPTSTSVTDPLGSVRTLNFTNVLGVIKVTGQSQPAGSGCSASAAALTYDANGNIASRTDFNGNETTYVYDLTRNLETSRTEGLTSAGATTSATRTITTTWHPTWRLPLVTTEYTGATATGTPLRQTTNVYDTNGNITSITESDPVHSVNRITTITYTYSTLVPGLVLTKVVDGPRTDVVDTTTYNYYPSNATCTASLDAPSVTNLGCRGQVQSIANALGQTTTFDRYNPSGQVEQMTDPNGVVTVFTHDARQRLLSRKVGSLLTSLTYDNAGQITKLTLPDNSNLNYTWDPAHRLTQIQDGLGNKVVYTLDSMGNRTNESTYDPSGVLAKTITRGYDALNRLQTLTGVSQ